MPYLFNHVHLKSPNPAEAANWYVKTFNFKIISDTDNFFGRGDKFIKCETEDGIVVNISGPQPGELLGDGDSSAHYGWGRTPIAAAWLLLGARLRLFFGAALGVKASTCGPSTSASSSVPPSSSSSSATPSDGEAEPSTGWH